MSVINVKVTTKRIDMEHITSKLAKVKYQVLHIKT